MHNLVEEMKWICLMNMVNAPDVPFVRASFIGQLLLCIKMQVQVKYITM